jgi:hypothetical protein
MKLLTRTRFLAAATLALAALGVASAAHARSDVSFSIGVQGAPAYVAPAPVYVQPRPVYVAPRPVYSQPQVYVAPVYGYSYSERARRHEEWRHRQWQQQHHWEQSRSHGRHWN